MPSEIEFHFEEYRALREEVELSIEELRKSKRNALVAVFAYYAWLATGGLPDQSGKAGLGGELVELAWYLPILIPIFGFVEYLGTKRRILDIAVYLKRLETRFADKELMGWEHHLAVARTDRPFQARAQGWSGFILWPLLFAITIVIALLA